jgi:hypothetical protein
MILFKLQIFHFSLALGSQPIDWYLHVLQKTCLDKIQNSHLIVIWMQAFEKFNAHQDNVFAFPSAFQVSSA